MRCILAADSIRALRAQQLPDGLLQDVSDDWTWLSRGDVMAGSPIALKLDDHNDHDDQLGVRNALMGTQSWTLAEAKAKFSEIIERAMSEGPQTITRNGRTAAVVVGAEKWQRKTHRVGNLAEFFAASPLRRSGLKVRRLRERPRKINL
jgi:prevent-host-death family protein